MKRNEACRLITRLAASSLIDISVSKDLFKARDIVVCEDNKILDVLATDSIREIFRAQTKEYIRSLLDTKMIDNDFAKQLNDLLIALDYGFEEGCRTPFLLARCQRCPNYKRESND